MQYEGLKDGTMNAQRSSLSSHLQIDNTLFSKGGECYDNKRLEMFRETKL